MHIFYYVQSTSISQISLHSFCVSSYEIYPPHDYFSAIKQTNKQKNKTNNKTTKQHRQEPHKTKLSASQSFLV